MTFEETSNDFQDTLRKMTNEKPAIYQTLRPKQKQEVGRSIYFCHWITIFSLISVTLFLTLLSAIVELRAPRGAAW